MPITSIATTTSTQPGKLKEMKPNGASQKAWLRPELIHKMPIAELYSLKGRLWANLRNSDNQSFTCVKSPYKSATGVQRKDGKWYWELTSDLEM